jgi:hypothetical protein
MKTRHIIATAALTMAFPVAHAIAEREDAREITLVGCVMYESEFRDLYGPGRSGPKGPGIGLRDEYVLVDAHELTSASQITTQDLAPCPTAPGVSPANAYELTGSNENEAAAYVGRRVQVSGIRKAANAETVGGVLEPTGGFDPLGHELHLFEVELSSIQVPEARTAAASETTTTTTTTTQTAEAPAPAPAVEQPAQPETPPPAAVAQTPPAPVTQAPQTAAAPPPQEQPRQVAQAQLPRTASPLPFIGLIGLLSLAAAAALRLAARTKRTFF